MNEGSRGYALLLVMMTVTLLLVALTAALPSVYMEAQREREEELIFRGNEYARAIALYHTKFNRYPATVDDLLKKTNGFRALRHAYKDPMTKGGKWRFIHVNAAGVLVDSKTMNMQSGAGTLGGNSPFGGTAGTTGLGQGGAFGSNAAGTGQGTSFGFGSTGSLGQMGGVGQRGPATPGDAGSGQNPSSATSSGNGDSQQPDQPAQSQSATGTQSAFSAGQTLGSYIAGVASLSKKKSIRILNKKTRYDEWEFLGVAIGTGLGMGGTQLAGAPGTASSGLNGPGLQSGTASQSPSPSGPSGPPMASPAPFEPGQGNQTESPGDTPPQ